MKDKKIYNGDNTIKYKWAEHPDIVFNMILYVYYVDGYISKELHKAIVLKMKELKW